MRHDTAGTGRKRVCVFGATGTIGRATVRALIERGEEVVAVVRRSDDAIFSGAQVKQIAGFDCGSLSRDIFAETKFDAVISCLASRTGEPGEAWAIDHDAHLAMLHAARQAGVEHFILLSAICVQKPRLAFQHAKLAFEAALVASGLTYTIVRPTAYFKSLSGQVDRVRRGRPFVVFGDGTLTACKPISDRDLAEFIADCLIDRDRWNTILPIGGPGDAISPRQQGEALFAILGRSARFRSVSPAAFKLAGWFLGLASRVVPSLAAKAELARIGHYYATESMLVLNPATGCYDPAATPSTGADTLIEHYRAMLAGDAGGERGGHAIL